MSKPIYDLLKSDHNKHRALLKELADTSGDSEKRQKLWSQFFCDVSSHAAAEEETFYGPMIEKEDGQPHARHSVAEHKELDDIVQELNEMDMSSPGWLTRFKSLRHRYEHHIDEEEEDIFPCAKDVLGADKSGELGNNFKARKAAERKLVEEKAEAALED